MSRCDWSDPDADGAFRFFRPAIHELRLGRAEWEIGRGANPERRLRDRQVVRSAVRDIGLAARLQELPQRDPRADVADREFLFRSYWRAGGGGDERQAGLPRSGR